MVLLIVTGIFPQGQVSWLGEQERKEEIGQTAPADMVQFK